MRCDIRKLGRKGGWALCVGSRHHHHTFMAVRIASLLVLLRFTSKLFLLLLAVCILRVALHCSLFIKQTFSPVTSLFLSLAFPTLMDDRFVLCGVWSPLAASISMITIMRGMSRFNEFNKKWGKFSEWIVGSILRKPNLWPARFLIKSILPTN